MTTNEERREVARRLRDLSSDAEEVSDFDIAKTLGLEAVSRYGYAPEDALHLADLIEPEPERTCRMVDCHTDDTCVINRELGNGNIVSMEFGYKQCSECGAYVFDCPTVRYCPSCGARVVDE